MSTTPQRIQLSRKAGFNLQQVSHELNGLPAVKVDRTTKWGNPYYGLKAQAETSVSLFRDDLRRGYYYSKRNGKVTHEEIRRELKGKNLACWCPLTDEQGQPVACHADVLLNISNEE